MARHKTPVIATPVAAAASKLHVPGWVIALLIAAGAGGAWLISGQVLAAFIFAGLGLAAIVADIVAHPAHLLRYGLGAVVLVALLKGPAGPVLDRGAGLPRDLNDVIGAEATKWYEQHGPKDTTPASTPPAIEQANPAVAR